MNPVELFYSYAHEDEALRDELAGHLKIMERRGIIRQWHDRCILPGQKWDGKINKNLQAADLVLLLISKDFINSDYIWSSELDIAMKRHERGEASVIPVMLRAVDIAGAPFEKLQGVPTDFRPVMSWHNRDEAWTDVAKGIRKVVEQIQAEKNKCEPTESLSVSPVITDIFLSWPRKCVTLDKIFKDIKFGSTRLDYTGSGATISFEAADLSDPILSRVLKEFSERVVAAGNTRGTGTVNQLQTEQYANKLIDIADQKRILWVDDRPEGNQFEIAALSKLQIEVVTVTGTKEALTRLESDQERFDLVLSDWMRPELHLNTLSAGIHLLRQLRKHGLSVPVIFYHGSFDELERATRHEQALREGAFGEAVRPDELLGLVTRALTGDMGQIY